MRMPRRESRHEFTPAMSFYKKYPDCVSDTYEEHNIDILRKKPGFYPVFCPFLALWTGDKKITKRRYFQVFGGARTHVGEVLTQQAIKIESQTGD